MRTFLFTKTNNGLACRTFSILCKVILILKLLQQKDDRQSRVAYSYQARERFNGIWRQEISRARLPTFKTLPHSAPPVVRMPPCCLQSGLNNQCLFLCKPFPQVSLIYNSQPLLCGINNQEWKSYVMPAWRRWPGGSTSVSSADLHSAVPNLFS